MKYGPSFVNFFIQALRTLFHIKEAKHFPKTGNFKAVWSNLSLE